MTDDPAPRRRSALQPLPTERDRDIRVVLADVVDVVGDGALHIALGIVLEELEQGDDGPRVLLESGQPRRPGQPRPRAFGNQAAHMRAGVAGPLDQARIGLVRIFHEIRADARFGGEALGELVLRAHCRLEMVEPVFLHEQHMGEIAEQRQAEFFGARMLRPERGDQHVGGLREGLRQVTL